MVPDTDDTHRVHIDPADGRTRRPHAVLDAPSRVLKAEKIIALVGPDWFAQARSVLEIGCGSGVIASTLARRGAPGLQVSAVDVVDNRLTHEGFDFQRVDGTTLPFADKQFDLVITNHVIEHVGDEAAQRHHLSEIRRVLRDDGRVYLAVPNTWRLVEPHYRLPLLSWLPRGLADRYVRASGKGTHYDCKPLGRAQARRLFEGAGFTCEDRTIEAIRTTLALEFPRQRAIGALARGLPDALFAPVMPVIATLVFRLRKPAS